MTLDKEKFKVVGCSDADADVINRPNITYWGDAWRRLKKNPVAIISLVILGIMIVMCLVGPFLTSYKFDAQDYNNLDKTPFGNHWFGTDNLGRDLFTRVWKGGRVSIYIGFIGALLEVVVGCLYGGVSGYFGGRIDTFMMRIIEVLTSIPDTVVVILLLLVLPPGINTLIIAMCIFGWTGIARLVRGQILQLKSSEYIMAAKALGASSGRIISKHLIPNTIGIIIVYMSMDIPGLIFYEAYLSFLGLGVQAPNTSWGALVFAGQGTMANHPHELIIPAVAICVTVLAFNLLGDGLRDALDPKLRQ